MPSSHPAPFSEPVLIEMAKLIAPDWRVLDPFAGTGRIHRVFADTYGIEIEPEWANMHPRTIVGDALYLPFADESFDCMATSPSYANRMGDKHKAKDGSSRISYTHNLRELTGDPDRTLHPHNSGGMQWGQAYRDMHRAFLAEARRVLRPGASFVLNVSDHYRGKQLQGVPEWWLGAAALNGFVLIRPIPVGTSRMLNGENRELRADHEWVFLLMKEYR